MLPAGVRGIAPLVRLPSACDRHVHAHLGAPMRPRHDLHCTAPSSDPPDDRLADAEPTLGNRVHVEPIAMIAHEDLNLVGAGLAIHGDGLAAMRHGVNYNYENGAYTEIPMTWNDAKRTLTIDARRGCYEGMLDERKFTVRMPDGSEKTVLYKGKKINVKF